MTPTFNISSTTDCVVNFSASHPGAPVNGVNILVGRDVAYSQTPCSTRGKPRTDYSRIYNVIPQDATEARAVEIFLQGWRNGKQTSGGSYDDAGVGDLTQRKAVLYDIPQIEQHTYKSWYIDNYPGTWVTFA